MNYLVDTNVLIYLLRGKRKIPEEIANGNLYVSAITYGELLTGVYKSNNVKKYDIIVKKMISDFDIRIIEVNVSIIQQYAKLRSVLEKEGNRIDDFDLLIASTALVCEYTLVTYNVKHFQRITKLKLANI